MVKFSIAGSRAREKQAAHGIPSALEKPATSERVVARVFARQGRDDGFRHVISNHLVGHRMPVVAAEAFGALSKLRIRPIRLTDTCEDPGGNERRVIEAVLRRQPELLSYRQRRKLRADAYGPVVGEDPENTLRLFSFVITFVRISYHGCVWAARFRLRACVRRLRRGLLPAQQRLFLRNCWRSCVCR